MESRSNTGGEVTDSLLTKKPNHRNYNDHEVGGGGGGCGDSQFTAVLGWCIFSAACGAFIIGYVLTYPAPTQSRIMNDLSLSVSEYSMFGSIVTIGGFLGAIISGKLTELTGRKWTIFAVDILSITGWLAIALAKGPWSLDLGRFLLGLAGAIGTYTANMYMAEITPKEFRGQLMSIPVLMIACGASLMDLIGSIIHWRVLALIGTIPCIAQLIILYFIPESPRWLAKVGREKESEAALRSLRGANANITEEATEIKESISDVNISRDRFLDMFQRKYARVLIVGIGLMTLQQLGGLNGYSLYTDSIFLSAGISSQVGFFIVAIIQFLMGMVTLALIDRYGRRALLLTSVVGAFLGSALTGFAFTLQHIERWKDATAIIGLISIVVYMGAYGLALGGLPIVIISEILPISIKGSAGSLFIVICSVFSWIVSYTFNFLLAWSSSGTFFIFAAVNGLGVLFVLKFVPETKGRSLEEIQASITHILQ